MARAKNTADDTEPTSLPRIPSLKEVKHNDFLWSRIIDSIDSANLVAIFVFFLNPELNLLLLQKYRFVLFPLAAVMSNVAAVWELRMALKDTDRHGKISRGAAFFTTLRLITAIAIDAAVLAGFSGIVSLAKVPSMMFILTLTLGTFVHWNAFNYRWGQSNAPAMNEKQQQSTYGMALGHAVVMLGLLMADLGVITTMFLGMTSCAPLGIIGGAILVYSNVKGYIDKTRSWNAEKAEEARAMQIEQAKKKTGDVNTIKQRLEKKPAGQEQKQTTEQRAEKRRHANDSHHDDHDHNHHHHSDHQDDNTVTPGAPDEPVKKRHKSRNGSGSGVPLRKLSLLNSCSSGSSSSDDDYDPKHSGRGMRRRSAPTPGAG